MQEKFIPNKIGENKDMVIGNILVKNFNTDELIFESEICDISIMGGRVYVSLGAGYRKDLGLVRNSVYKIEITCSTEGKA